MQKEPIKNKLHKLLHLVRGMYFAKHPDHRFISLANVVKSNMPRHVYFDYQRMHEMITGEIEAEFSRILAFRTEEEIAQYTHLFEMAYQDYLGANRCVATASCTAALTFALNLLDIGANDEVIIPVNTYIATALAVCDVGARPVFIDVDEDGLLDVQQLKSVRTEKTKAIIPVHLYGMPCDMDPIMYFAKENNFFVIEDAAQAHGTVYQGKKVGTIGDCGCFSLHSSKLLGGLSNGGMLVVNKKRLLRNPKALQNPIIDDPFVFRSKRTPDQLNPFNAALSWIKLKHLEQYLERRIAIAGSYSRKLSKVEALVLPPTAAAGNRITYRNYIIKTQKRDSLQKYLSQKGVETKIFYRKPLHMMKIFDFLSYNKGEFPKAEWRAEQILALPNAPYLSDIEVDEIANAVSSFYE
jgi:dTDP-4-amino-4,6-dideoxygalactose transaminase